ncbi:MAG: NAD-dependent epimerase/dehydratase family protein [Gammaproteobacteria bacterium]|nr:NAD-dependent epimerase/dehydratase family protein [Gammaproteobacteria bacterium]
MKKYLVTGGAGFIGSHLTDALLAQGHSVLVLDDCSSGYLENIYPDYRAASSNKLIRDNLTFIKGSISDQTLVSKCLEGVSGCFHLAAHLGMAVCKEDWVGTHLINLTATITLFDAIQKNYQQSGNKIPVVYASSAAVYGDLGNKAFHEDLKVQPLSAYGADKLGCELHAYVANAIYGIPSVGLRFFNVYGPRQRPDTIDSGVIPIFIDRIMKGLDLKVFGSGEQTRDFVHVRDVVQHCLFFMETMSDKASVFNVCSGTAIRLNELITLLGQLSHQPLSIQHRPERPGDVFYALGNPEKAKAMGITCQIPLEEGLEQLWETYQ